MNKLYIFEHFINWIRFQINKHYDLEQSSCTVDFLLISELISRNCSYLKNIYYWKTSYSYHNTQNKLVYFDEQNVFDNKYLNISSSTFSNKYKSVSSCSCKLSIPFSIIHHNWIIFKSNKLYSYSLIFSFKYNIVWVHDVLLSFSPTQVSNNSHDVFNILILSSFF